MHLCQFRILPSLPWSNILISYLGQIMQDIRGQTVLWLLVEHCHGAETKVLELAAHLEVLGTDNSGKEKTKRKNIYSDADSERHPQLNSVEHS